MSKPNESEAIGQAGPISLAGAIGEVVTGVVLSAIGYEFLSLTGGFLTLLCIPILIWEHRDRAIGPDQQALAFASHPPIHTTNTRGRHNR